MFFFYSVEEPYFESNQCNWCDISENFIDVTLNTNSLTPGSFEEKNTEQFLFIT